MNLRAGLLAFVGAFACVAHADPVTIRFTSGDASPDGMKTTRAIIAAFERAHPNIRVKFEPVTDNYENKLLSQYAANTAPDVAVMNPNRIVMFSDRGALKPLNDFPDLDSPEVDLSGRYPNIVRSFTWKGKLYALPRDVACSAYVFYNKELFRKAGIPYPTGDWTWDTKVRPELKEKDFVWVMQQLTKRDPGAKRNSQYGYATAWPQLWMEILLASSNVRMWDSDEHPTKLNAANPAVVDIFQFASNAINKDNWMPSNNDIGALSGSSVEDEFIKGRIAMYSTGSWAIRELRKKMKDDWDIAPFPKFARGESDYLPGEGAGLGIFASSKHPKEAWAWVKWMSGPNGLIPIARAGNGQPSIRKLAQTPGIWLPAKDAKDVDRRPEHIGITDETVLRVYNRQLPIYFSGVANSVQGSYYNVLTGTGDPLQTLKKLDVDGQKQLNLALRRTDSTPYPFYPALAVGILITLGLVAWIYWPERGRRLSRVEREESRSAYLFLIPWIFGLAFTVGPMIYSFLLSFAESDIIQTPKWRGLGNYADATNLSIDDSVWISIRQTFIFAIFSIPLGLMTALGLSLLLNQKVKGVPLFRALYYLPSLASGVAIALIWARVFHPEQGLLNSLIYGHDGKGDLLGLGTLLSNWAGTPDKPINWIGNPKTVIPSFILMGMWGAGGGTIIFLAGLQSISQTYYEAATLDGAGIWRKFRNVTLPLLTPTLFFALVTGVIGSLQVFSEAFVLTDGGPDRATLFYMVNLYKKAFGELQMGFASAMAWILFAIILLLTVIQFRFSKWVHYEGELK